MSNQIDIAMVEQERALVRISRAFAAGYPEKTKSKLPSVKLTDDEQEMVALKAVISLLVELLEIFGFDCKGYRPSDAVEAWSVHVKELGWMKWTKYKLAAYFAYHNAQELPKSPSSHPDNPGDLLTGRACRFMRKLLATTDRFTRMEFLFSVLQLKKGLPRPDKKALKKAIADTLSQLTTYKPPIAATATGDKGVWDEETYVTFSDLQTEVRDTVREVFKGHIFKTQDALKAFMPSMSANYNNTRSMLGTLGDLLDTGSLQVGVPQVEDVELQVERPRVVADPVEFIGAPRDAVRTHVVTNYSILEDQFSTVYLNALEKAESEEPLVIPVALAEALKVRVISKGPQHTYFVLKPVQKFMWRVLADHPVFQLVGRPVTEEILISVLGDWLSPEASFLSGDYKAATDNIRAELTEVAWLEIARLCKFPTVLTALGLRALTGHTFEDPLTGEQLPQQAGQLMGSIISFPILCIINAAVCRAAMSVDHAWQRRPLGRKVMKNDQAEWHDVLPLLINGDDCLFPATARVRARWKILSTMAGLEESVGKTYFSRDFANVNSTNFLWVPSDDYGGGSFRKTGFINMGLVTGQKRSVGMAASNDHSDIASRLTDLLSTAPDAVRTRTIWKHFLRHNSSELELYTRKGIPWFVPKVFGGVGLPEMAEYEDIDSPPSWFLGMTRTDRRVVRAMLQHTHPKAPQPQELKDPAALLLHQFACDTLERAGIDMSVKGYSFTPDACDLRPMYLWSLFLRPRDLEDYLFISTTPCPVQRTLEHHEQGKHRMTSPDLWFQALLRNQRVWRFYMKRLSQLPPPLEGKLLPRFAVRGVALLYE